MGAMERGVGKRVSLSRCYLRARVIDCSLEIVGAMPPLLVLFYILLKNPPPPHRIALEKSPSCHSVVETSFPYFAQKPPSRHRITLHYFALKVQKQNK